MVSQVESLALIESLCFRWLLIGLAGLDQIHRAQCWLHLYHGIARLTLQSRLGFAWPAMLQFDRIGQQMEQSK